MIELLLNIQTEETTEADSMDVHDPILKCVNEILREQTHITGETNQLNVALSKLTNDVRIMFFTRSAATFDDHRLNSALTCLRKPGAFALSLITTATSEAGISPLFTASTSATIFDPGRKLECRSSFLKEIEDPVRVRVVDHVRVFRVLDIPDTCQAAWLGHHGLADLESR